MRRPTTLGSCAAAAILLAGCTQDRPTALSPSDLDNGPSFAAAPATAGAKIPGQYIVRLRDDVQDVAGLAMQIADANGGTIRYLYTHAIKGFAVNIPDAAAAAIARHSSVLYVEQDQVVRLVETQTGATWGLDRIDQRSLPLSTTYTYNADGTGVTAYIIDTGIRLTHSEFTGRIRSGHDAIDGGTDASVIEGIDWVTADHAAGTPAVANMSLGGGFSQALNDAVMNSVNDGVIYAVAAGNGYGNACDGSPASEATALTVGSTTSTDAESSFSDRGPCLDIWAPGSGITSAWIGSDNATNTISGTSMATPHVAGGAALYLQGNPTADAAQVDAALSAAATTGKITWSNPFGLKPPPPPAGQDYLLYTLDFTGGPPPPPPPPPADPSTLTATAASYEQINLTWVDNSSNESGFRIE